MSSDCSYFDSPYIRGSVAVLAFFVLLFALAAVSYAISQRRIPSPFKVTRWYNYGLTLLLWNLYMIARLIALCLQACWITNTISDSWRVILTQQILFHLAMLSLLGTVLLPVCRGLERLRGTHSKGWHVAATVLLSLYTILMIIYLGLLIWQASSIIEVRLRSFRSSAGVFPEYIYVYTALLTLWFVIALAAVAKILLTANRAHVHLPSSLKIWVLLLAFGLFSLGFLYVFYVYYYNISRHSVVGNTAGASMAWTVLWLVFSWLPVFAIREVSRILSAVLASTEYGARKATRGRGYDPEHIPAGFSGSRR